mgnify:CR=1 FL=1
METQKRKANFSLINAIISQHSIKQRMLEISIEIISKMESGIPVPKRLQVEFEQLSQELSIEISNQGKAEMALGVHQNCNFILN